MKIELFPVKVKELFAGYCDNGEDGVFGYGGMLSLRPPYQREFVYNLEQSEAVIHTVLKGYPLNVMYWVNTGNSNYECLDGQQRSLAICKYLNHEYPITVNGNVYYVDSLPDDLYDQLINYELMIYVCEGSTSEKLEWFRVVNIAGEKLTDQELRNSVYTGPWLSDAKRHFSKSTCAAKAISDKLIKGSPIRQELLEYALKSISAAQGVTIEEYMSAHQNDDNCDELWIYFQNIINWVNTMFPLYYKEMYNQDWGAFYNEYHNNTYSPSVMQQRVKELMGDEEVTSKRGIFRYVLSGNEKYLSLRSFDDRDKRTIYMQQGGKCAICGKPYPFDKMQGDHITPWSQGGKTEISNLQMLCTDCNLKKSNH